MGIGFIVSFIVVGIWSIIILGITIPMDKKYVVRENGKLIIKKQQFIYVGMYLIR